MKFMYISAFVLSQCCQVGHASGSSELNEVEISATTDALLNDGGTSLFRNFRKSGGEKEKVRQRRHTGNWEAIRDLRRKKNKKSPLAHHHHKKDYEYEYQDAEALIQDELASTIEKTEQQNNSDNEEQVTIERAQDEADAMAVDERLDMIQLGADESDEWHKSANGWQKSQNLKPTSRYVVQYANDQGLADAMALGGQVFHHFPDHQAVVLELDDESTAYLDGFDKNIVSIEYDNIWVEEGYLERHLEEDEVRRLQASTGENMPYGIKLVQADQVEMGDYPIKVCVADTGVASKHPDLKKSKLSGANRYNSKDGALLYWNQDVRGHGSHVTGTIAAQCDNSIGVCGINENIPVYNARALDNNGLSSESDVRRAIEQCVSGGAWVISMSLGGSSMTDSMKEYLASLYYDKGLILVSAAGNDGQNIQKWPGALPEVISVAAVDEYSKQWSGSNWASTVELAAPGKSILSTSVDRTSGAFKYSYYSGTSMAVPHVSGVAALLWSHHPECTNDQIRYALAIAAKDLSDGTSQGGYGCDEKFGYGLIQAREALDFLNENPCDSSKGNFGGSAYKGGCNVL